MKTIWKYKLEIADVQEVGIPLNANIIHAGADPIGGLCLWAEVDTDIPPCTRTVYLRGTGHPLPPPEAKHIGSAVFGPFVWHVYI